MPSGIGIAGNALLAAVLVLCGCAAVFSLPLLLSNRQGCLKLFFAARRAMFAAIALCAAVLMLLAVAFLTNDFSIAAVAQYSCRSLGFFYKLSAVWAGSAGSLLLWSTALFVMFGIRLSKVAPDQPRFAAGVLFIGAAVCLVFTAIVIFVERPFVFSAVKIDDGAGLNPLLQNFWNIIHPPLLFVGYSALLIPFVLSCVYVLVGKTNRIDIYPVLRRWLLLGLCFLTLGIVTGARWSYLELGWGGYWAWDPVENASLLPWLTALAAVHCLAGVRFSDGFKFWTIVLAPVPFILSLLATFITRSGILASVHSFGESAISYPLLAFIACCFVLWLICVVRAARTYPFGIVQDTTALLSKTHILVWAVVVFVFTAVIIGAATLWPAFAGLHWPTALTEAFYDKIAAAAGILSAFLIALAALAGIRKRPGFLLKISVCSTAGVTVLAVMYALSTQPFVLCLACAICAFGLPAVFNEALYRIKARFRLGAVLCHIGLLLLVVTAGFSSGQNGIQLPLRGQKPAQVGQYQLTYQSFEHQLKNGVTQAGPRIVLNNKAFSRTLWPHTNIYGDGQKTSEPAVCIALFEDIYVLFDGVGPEGAMWVTVMLNPLMLWLWVAFALIAGGSAVALVENRGKNRRGGLNCPVEPLGPENSSHL